MITYEFEIYLNGYEVAFKVSANMSNATNKIMDKLFSLSLTRKDIVHICLSCDDNVILFLDDLIGYGIVSEYKLHAYTEGCGL